MRILYFSLIFLLFPLLLEALHSGSCVGLVCGRNGNCHSGPVNNNSEPTYWCRCDEGFGGDFCEQRCDLECQVGEKCVYNENLEATCVCQDCDKRGVRHLVKPNCPSGYGGVNCETAGWCFPDLCRNGGLCIGSGNSAKCVCPNGFRGDRCQIDVDECRDSNDCGPRSTCMNTHGSYLCVCPQGLLPPDCLKPGNQSSVELKPSACFLEVNEEFPNGRNMYCQNGGFCDKSSRVPTCHCPPGFHGTTCEISSEKSDPCAANPCSHGTCSSFPGGFQCMCDDGYGGSFCEDGQDNCADHKCEAGSVCINGRDSYQCDCPPGRTGQYCEKVDCTAITGICNHGSCFQNPLSDKSFECQCLPGYEGELCDMDINECHLNNVCLNNGTCVNLPGSFRCDCPRGYGGKFCEEFVDTCKDVHCEHGGVCVLTSNRSPVCQCRTGYIGRRCEKECPAGFGGVRCDVRLESGVCSRHVGKCFNNGKCIGGFCACPADFTGNQCELTRKDVQLMASENTCETDPCMNNATCIDVDAHIGYVCICKPGFEGDICERRKDVCLENPCANGGVCERRGRSFTCTCPAGFQGERCEKEKEEICRSDTCKNGGICHNDGSSARCECSYGFTGQRCEQTINLGMFYDKETLLRSVCEKRKCWERANDGNCDADCNYAACKFDGGDCSGKREPFSRCNYGNMCADLFSNGVCDQACNNEDCLYDGMDCMSAVVRCPAKIREYCAARFANGICDSECNTDGCGFDGGDCANRTEAVLLANIRINIQMEASEFQVNGGQTLMELSSALRAAVRIQKDEEGPLVFEWDGEKELGRVEMDVKKLSEQRVLSTSLVKRIRRAMHSEKNGVVAYLEVQEDCVKGKCLYTDSQSVVDIISARLAKKGTDSFGVPISEAMIATPRKHDSSATSTWNNMIIFLGLGCVVCVGMAGVLSIRENRNRKRKMINAPVWIPPMEHEEKNRKTQSANSSQHSLLEPNGYFDPKRHCAEFGVEQNGQYHHLYSQSYGYNTGEFGHMQMAQQQHIHQQRGLVAENIPLHIEASGSGRITSMLTTDSVNQEDTKYRRRVLHWLAANANKKPEELIAEEAEKCVKAGADVNAIDCDENTALMLAVKSRRIRLAIILMRGGADPTIYNKSERSALHEAAVNSDLRMMELLLTDLRLVKDIDELDRCGRTVLMEVARSEGRDQVDMARLLISKGAKIDSDGAARKDSEIYHGRTALHYAALNDNLPMVEFLVSQNANKDKQDEAGHTPIMLAAKEGHDRIVMALIRNGASVEAVDALDHSARQLAQEKHYQHIVDIFDRYRPELDFSLEMAMRHQQQPQQQPAAPSARKAARPSSFKPAKKTNRKAKETSSNSRDSTHLTPPPSDGSTSSPSPQHFMATTHTTPTSINYMSPEYQPEVGSSEGFQPQCSALPNGGMWYTSSPPYPAMSNEPMMRHHSEAAYQYY